MEKLSTEAARLERTLDWMVIFIAFCLFMGAFHLHAMLMVGDWDFWTDWKDRRWWVTITPIALITFPAAVQTFLWEKLRLPFGATFCVLVLVLGQWASRIVNFYGWTYYPLNFTWPATLLCSPRFAFRWSTWAMSCRSGTSRGISTFAPLLRNTSGSLSGAHCAPLVRM